MQYLQSNTQALLMSTFKSEMHRPSAAKLWQMPQLFALPILFFSPSRSTPLDVQATSYLAASAKFSIFQIHPQSNRPLIRTYVLILIIMRNICFVKAVLKQ